MLKKPSSCIVPGLCHSRRACLSQHSNYGSSNWYARDKIRLFPHWRNGCLGHVSAARIMVVIWTAVFPEDGALRIDFGEDAAAIAGPRGEETLIVGTLTPIKQVAIRQQVAVEPGTVRQRPLVHDLAFEVDEVHVALSRERREERVAGARAVRVEYTQPGAAPADGVLIDRSNLRAHGVVSCVPMTTSHVTMGHCFLKCFSSH